MKKCLLLTCTALLAGCFGLATVTTVNEDGTTTRQIVRIPAEIGRGPTRQQREINRQERRKKPAFMSLKTMFSDPQVRALAKAAGRGDVEKVDRLIEQGVDVNVRGTSDTPPLFWPLRRKNLKGFERLLEHGADPNAVFGLSESTIMSWAAAIEGDFLKVALDHGGDPNLVDPYTGKPLLSEIGRADDYIKKLLLLVSRGADVDLQHCANSTPMMDLMHRTRFDAVLTLLDLGANPRVLRRFGDGLRETVAFFLQYGKRRNPKWQPRPEVEEIAARLESLGLEIPNWLDDTGGAKARRGSVFSMNHLMRYPDPIMGAAANALSHDRLDKFGRLIEEGLDVNARGTGNATLLMVPADTNRMIKKSDVQFKRLLELGADPNIVFDDGTSVMHHIALNANDRRWKLAMQHGGDPNLVETFEGTTPIFKAIEACQPANRDILSTMLDTGVDIDAQSRDGDTPVMFAAMLKEYETVLMLLEHGADHWLANHVTGLTLMDWIAYHRHKGKLPFKTAQQMERVVDWLDDRGAGFRHGMQPSIRTACFCSPTATSAV